MRLSTSVAGILLPLASLLHLALCKPLYEYNEVDVPTPQQSLQESLNEVKVSVKQLMDKLAEKKQETEEQPPQDLVRILKRTEETVSFAPVDLFSTDARNSVHERGAAPNMSGSPLRNWARDMIKLAASLKKFDRLPDKPAAYPTKKQQNVQNHQTSAAHQLPNQKIPIQPSSQKTTDPSSNQKTPDLPSNQNIQNQPPPPPPGQPWGPPFPGQWEAPLSQPPACRPGYPPSVACLVQKIQYGLNNASRILLELECPASLPGDEYLACVQSQQPIIDELRKYFPDTLTYPQAAPTDVATYTQAWNPPPPPPTWTLSLPPPSSTDASTTSTTLTPDQPTTVSSTDSGAVVTSTTVATSTAVVTATTTSFDTAQCPAPTTATVTTTVYWPGPPPQPGTWGPPQSPPPQGNPPNQNGWQDWSG